MEEQQIKRPRRTSEEIRNLLTSFTQTDMGAKAFCKMHGISEGVFYKWKARHLNKPLAKQTRRGRSRATEEPQRKKNGLPTAAEKAKWLTYAGKSDGETLSKIHNQFCHYLIL